MHLVIGLGETGGPLYEVLCDKLGGWDVLRHDPDKGYHITEGRFDVKFMHICIPYLETFVNIVETYQRVYNPEYTIIHSTVPIGTTRKIGGAVHSPILGRHNRMKEDLLAYPKWVGGVIDNSEPVIQEFCTIWENVKRMATPDKTEALKLMCLAKYGVSLAFAEYQRKICEELDMTYDAVIMWDMCYNQTVGSDLQRPIFRELKLPIGGHCVVQNTKILNEQHPNPMLEEVIKNG